MVAGLEHLQHHPQVARRLAARHAAEDQLSEPADALVSTLVAAGLEPRPVSLFDQAGSPTLAGHAVVVGRTEIVSRLLDPATVLIVRVRRLEAGAGLASPIQGIPQFVDILARTREATGLGRVVGVVDTSLFRSVGGLDDTRLGAFYSRLHGVRDIDAASLPGLGTLDRQLAGKAGVRWVELELARFRGVRPRGYRDGPR